VHIADTARADLDQEVLRTNLAWLLRLRWVAIAGQIITVLAVYFWMRIDLPLWPVTAIVGFELLTNAASAGWARGRPNVREWALAVLMALDVVLLTALLYFTGGPVNPFSFLYVVHIALAAVVLRAYWTWGLLGLSFAGFGSLFLGDTGPTGAWFEHPEEHMMHMRMHMQGMWIAFGLAAVFIVYFVTRVTRDLARREAELARARAAAERSEKLASLATLAAGAAHELATPLSTIAVVARELERSLERAGALEAAVADARLIRNEVTRCRGILEQLATDAGASAGEAFAELSVHGLLDKASEGLPQRERIRSAIAGEAEHVQLFLPARAVAQAVRGVLENALQASPPESSVLVHANKTAERCAIVVEDHGPGMPPEVLSRVGEPFFTTKEPGKGMGLGLFLTRVVLERIGGGVAIDSRPGEGTRVELSVPLRAYATPDSRNGAI
jgi:two-component system sensor histidine kinase RegB